MSNATINHDKRVTCTCCDGKGTVSIFKVLHTCGKCHGSGTQPVEPAMAE